MAKKTDGYGQDVDALNANANEERRQEGIKEATDTVLETLAGVKTQTKATVNQFANDNFLMKKPLLSIVAICPNEYNDNEYEQYLKWLPGNPLIEIVIVANTVTPNETCSIASREGNTTIGLHTLPAFEFDTCRNKAKELARGEWILSLDLDERVLTPIDEILTKLQSCPIQVDGLKVIMTTQGKIEGKNEIGVHSWHSIKLFRNREYIKFEGRVHELVSGTLSYAMQTDVVIQHYGYSVDDTVLHNKLKRNFALLVKELHAPRTQATYNNAYDSMLKTASQLSKYQKI